MSNLYYMCRRCKVKAEIVFKESKPYNLKCPSCGAVEQYKVAIEIAARNHFEDMIVADVKSIRKRKQSKPPVFIVGKP